MNGSLFDLKQPTTINQANITSPSSLTYLNIAPSSVVISSGFVHRSHLMWQKSPTQNHLWVLVSLALVIGQLFYNHLVLKINLNSSKVPFEFLTSLPLHIWLISFSWPILALCINSLVKRAEIKATTRQQRRARFDFNTKLGMNSPF